MVEGPSGENPSPKPLEQRFRNQLAQFKEQRAYNNGLNTAREFEYRGHVYKSPPIKVHDRKIFIQECIDGGIVNFAMMDIVSLRQADMATDSRGNSSADLLLNGLSHIVDGYLKKYNGENPGKRIRFCRYGGDEFAFSYSGMTQKEISEANAQIKAAIGKMYGFYKPQLRGEEIEKRNIEVGFEQIVKPNDVLGKLIFDHFISNGVILKEEDITKLKLKFKNMDSFTKWEGEQSVYAFYPENVKTVDQKLAYISRINPLLQNEIASLSRAASLISHGNQEVLLRELEDMFIDPLLKSPILSGADLMANIKAGNISHVWTRDLKFLKEFNRMSYADGDNAIKILWSSIRGSISKADWDKLVFARNGGTFLIGLKEGQTLSQETVDKLSELTSIYYQDIVSDRSLTVIIGHHDHEVDMKLRKKRYGLRQNLSDDEKLELIALSKEETKQLFNKPDEKFYEQLAQYLVSPYRVDDNGIGIYWDRVFSGSHTNIEGLYTTSLVHDYFISKRAVQHLIGLERALDRLEEGGRMSNRFVRQFNHGAAPTDQLQRHYNDVLKRVRQAIEYSYSHNMLDQTELTILGNIMSGGYSILES